MDGRRSTCSIELTGFGSGKMLEHVHVARRWVLSNAEAVAAALSCCPSTTASESSPVMLPPEEWWRWDLHVHLLGGWDGMERPDYTAAVALAMVSFFTGR